MICLCKSYKANLHESEIEAVLYVMCLQSDGVLVKHKEVAIYCTKKVAIMRIIIFTDCDLL